MVMRCPVSRLSSTDFDEFGQVFDVAHCADRPLDAGRLRQGRSGSRPSLLGLRVDPKPLPLLIQRLERHRFSSQSFIPLDPGRYWVIVAPSDSAGLPEPHRMRAFVAEDTQIVTLNPGTWHFQATTLTATMRFAIVMWCEELGADTEFATIADVTIE